MAKRADSRLIGLAVLLLIVTGFIGWKALAAVSGGASPGLTLREAFPQAPAAPPPVSPPVTAVSSLASAPSAPISPAIATDVVVHVAGAVHRPGVYHLPLAARNDDAVKAAGGANGNANTDAINLAARVTDGSQLYVPTRKEQPIGGAMPETLAVGLGVKPTSGRAAASGKAAHGTGRAGHSGKLTDASEGQINLNTADANELQRLPGVGPAMALKILDFRKQNGAFHVVEDLLQISGIGEKKFAKMAPLVRVRQQVGGVQRK